MSKDSPPLINADSAICSYSVTFFCINKGKHVRCLKIHPTPAYLRRRQKFPPVFGCARMPADYGINLFDGIGFFPPVFYKSIAHAFYIPVFGRNLYPVAPPELNAASVLQINNAFH